MNQFEPASLSPLPKTPVECPLPYDLTWDDLLSILPGFKEREGAGMQVYSSYEKQGLNGGSNSCIITLRYPTWENQFRSKTVFIKHTSDPEKMEAQKYQFLASRGVPTPHLLSSIRKDNAEIILLEFLPKIGIDFHSASEVNSLLDLMAHLNSIQDPPDLFHPSPGIPQAEFDERVRTALIEVAQNQSLSIAIDIPRWLDAYQFACATCKSMPLAVNHNEFSFQQVGWAPRDGTNKLVMFDLETMSLSPRFADIAGVLTRLAMYTRRDQIELFKIYLARLCERIPLKLEVDEALQELRLVQIKDAFDSLPWHVDIARRPDLDQMLDKPLAINARSLHDNLLALGFL